MFRQILNPVVGLLAVTMLLGCGGGAGSTSFVGGADLSFSLSPKTIDTGDRTKATLKLSNVHPDGIVIKVRYPKELAFVAGSAELQVADEEVELEPDFLGMNEDDDFFLVFILDKDAFGFEEQGDLIFELRGIDSLEDGEVDVDVDINDTNSFDVENPEFSPEATETINVKD